jgi:methionyl-tRNA formyltransferase
MKVVFLGTPDLAVPSLEAVCRNHDVRLVVTQPDRPRGRGRQLAPPPVKERAAAIGLPVWQPSGLRGDGTLERLQATGAEVLAVVAYGHFIPDSILEAVPHGAVNLHFSLLPAYRGAAPVNRAVMAGERQTGVTTFRITSQMDAGPVYLKRSLAIGPAETAGDVAHRLAVLGAPLLAETLDGLAGGALPAERQDESLATRAPKMRKEDGRIDWNRESRKVVCHILGVNPWPGAFTLHNGRPLKIWRAAADTESPGGPPGTVLSASAKEGLRVAAKEGSVVIEEVQSEGKRRMSPVDFLAGHPLAPGTLFT